MPIRIKVMDEATDVEPIEDEVQEETPEMSYSGTVDPSVARYLGPEAMCQSCIHFLEPDACEIVAGPVDPDGVCSLFTPDEEYEE